MFCDGLVFLGLGLKYIGEVRECGMLVECKDKEGRLNRDVG